MRKVNSMDAGIFQLSDGRIIQFLARWSRGNDQNQQSEYHELELWAQLFDDEGTYQTHGYVDSIWRGSNPEVPVVNWKDHRDRFYLLDPGGKRIPTIRRITLDLPD